ncbi:hypothetical protein HWV07_08955 [Natronomonas salina]|uniref:hypothetical protein n=1 Tax=Natronomonas salina TaxID=1710540 RepID=UPI0015B48DE4|nr:hypothetical protein [Natronomonas salina]QLD89153.1 hypothetical protein HWV07_08955 [Natronomonas salina]
MMSSFRNRLFGDDTSDKNIDLEVRQQKADETLRAAIELNGFTVVDCGVTDTVVVNESRDGEKIVVPITQFSLGSDIETPDTDLVWDFVGEAATALQDPFHDVFVRHYDIQFSFGGEGFFNKKTCRRVLLTKPLVDKYTTDPDFSLAQLRNAVDVLDTIDDEIAPVAWGECYDYRKINNGAVIIG